MSSGAQPRRIRPSDNFPIGLSRYSINNLYLNKRQRDHVTAVVNNGIRIAEKLEYAHTDKVIIAGALHDVSWAFTGKNRPFVKESDLFTYVRDNSYIFERNDIFIDNGSGGHLTNIDIVHAPASAALSNLKFNVFDRDILAAISHHHTGARYYEDMSMLEKIIFLSEHASETEHSKTTLSLLELEPSPDLAVVHILQLSLSLQLLQLEKNKAPNLHKLDLAENLYKKTMSSHFMRRPEATRDTETIRTYQLLRTEIEENYSMMKNIWKEWTESQSFQKRPE